MSGSSPDPSDGGPLLLPADGGLLAGRLLGGSGHHPPTRGCPQPSASWGHVSSVRHGFTMFMFQFHAWAQKSLGKSYLCD